MDSFEWNKLIGAVLGSALIVMFINTFTESLFHSEDGELAYTIEVADASGGEAAEVEQGPSLAELLAGIDPTKGEREFAGCKGCHTIEKGGANKAGPNLYGVLGRAVAGADGFGYSSALSGVGGNWDWDKMDAWLTNPSDVADGTSMSFRVSKADRRASLIAWLNTQSDAPLPLPAIEAVVEEAADMVEEAAGDMMDGAVEAADDAMPADGDEPASENEPATDDGDGQ